MRRHGAYVHVDAGNGETMSRVASARSKIRPFLRRNANLLTAILVVAIIVEGSVAWFYPSRWWQPLVAIVAVSLLVLAWRNLKAAIKFVASLGLTVMLAALAIQSGFYLTSSAVGGTIWGLSVLSSWAVSVLTSYMVVSTRSRWGVALASTISSYAVSYLFMEIGVVGVYLISVVASVLVTIVLLKSDWFSRMSKRSPRFLADWKRGKIADAMKSLWPSAHEGDLKLTRKQSLPAWHGVGSPTVMFVPLDLDESMESTTKHGITYHGRDVRAWLLWLSRKIASKGLRPAPLVILVDVNGANDSTSTHPEIIRVPDVDSTKAVYYGLMDGTGSRNNLRNAIADLARRFEGMEKATVKSEARLAKLLDCTQSADGGSGAESTKESTEVSSSNVESDSGSPEDKSGNSESK